MRIVVTGACGSVGQCVVQHAIAQGHEVIGVDIGAERNADPVPVVDEGKVANPVKKYTFIQADLRDYETALKVFANCDALIHLAAIRWPGDGRVETHNTCGILFLGRKRSLTESNYYKEMLPCPGMCFEQRRRWVKFVIKSH